MKDFKNYNILIIGDIMLDKYIYGNIEKISPEAPVPVFEIKSNDAKPGGAANVALNIKSLGSTPLLMSILGDDRDGNHLIKLLKKNKIDTFNVLREIKTITTVKTRLMANGQHILRIDEEKTEPLHYKMEELISYLFEENLENNKIDAVIIQDYNKGLLNESLIEFVIEKAGSRNIFTAVDPKINNFLTYKNVDLFKPNLKEIEIALNRKIGTEQPELEQAAIDLHSVLNYKNLFITLGEKGIFYSDGAEFKIFPTKQIDVVDVSGAGDAVLSVATLAFLEGMNIEKIAELSNIAGGLACQKMGVATIGLKQLKEKIL